MKTPRVVGDPLGLEPDGKVGGVSSTQVGGAAAAAGDALHLAAARAVTLPVRIIRRRHVSAADAREALRPWPPKHRAEFAAHDTIRTAYDLV